MTVLFLHFIDLLFFSSSWQVALLKKRAKAVSEGDIPHSEDTSDSTSSTQSPLEEGGGVGAEAEGTEGRQMFAFSSTEKKEQVSLRKW